jgi:hypothetical protein
MQETVERHEEVSSRGKRRLRRTGRRNKRLASVSRRAFSLNMGRRTVAWRHQVSAVGVPRQACLLFGGQGLSSKVSRAPLEVTGSKESVEDGFAALSAIQDPQRHTAQGKDEIDFQAWHGVVVTGDSMAMAQVTCVQNHPELFRRLFMY